MSMALILFRATAVRAGAERLAKFRRGFGEQITNQGVTGTR